MRKILIIQKRELKMSWRSMLYYFVNNSRNTGQLCFFVETALVWLISPAVQTTWTSPQSKLGKLHPAPPTLPKAVYLLCWGVPRWTHTWDVASPGLHLPQTSSCALAKPGRQSAVLSARIHCRVLLSLLLCRTLLAFRDAGNKIAIRPVSW